MFVKLAGIELNGIAAASGIPVEMAYMTGTDCSALRSSEFLPSSHQTRHSQFPVKKMEIYSWEHQLPSGELT